jgi:GT2 family glycosyltransferase
MAGAGVLAVLVAHGSGVWLREALAALTGLRYSSLDIVVVTVGDVDLPADVLPRRRLKGIVAQPARTGFAEAVNAGLAQTASDAPYVLLLHDDAAPAPDAVQHLVDLADANPDAAVIGAKLVEWDEPEILQEVGGSIDRFGARRAGLEAREVDHGQHDGVSDAVFASAACLLIRRSALDEHGFDPEAWPLYEDVDLCWRVRAGGARVIVAPAARVRHAAALSRGLRGGGGAGFGPVAVRTHVERGRLWFMLKNYRPLTVALILPQYLVIAGVSLVRALVRREFWRLRVQLTAWVRVAGELPRIIERRRRAPPRHVHDEEILSLAARQAAAARRYARVAVLGRIADAFKGAEERFGAAVRDPLTWASVAALIVVLLALRGVLGAGTFTLGRLRPAPALGNALSGYLARFRDEGVDPSAPAGAGILVLGALRSIPLVSAALAEKAALIGPLLLASFGGLRLGRVLGLGATGRRWLAIGLAANPATLVLVRTGAVGPLVLWAAASWLAAAFLVPSSRSAGRLAPEDVRQRARWAFGWAVVAALHPPALLWLTALAVAVAVSSADDRAGRRWRQIMLGAGGAIALNLPWSVEWFAARSPLWGRGPGVTPSAAGGLDAATFGAGWPLLAWTAIALVVAMAVRPSRLSLALVVLLGGAWLAGVRGAIAGPTALAVAGWCTVALLANAGRSLREELPRYALGWRQIGVLAVGAVLAAGWAAGGIGAIIEGTHARTVAIVPTNRDATGRVLWLIRSQSGTTAWATKGFSQVLGDWPGGRGQGDRLVLRSLAAARAGKLHRLGSVLALADVSHVVALDQQSRAGLRAQADLAEEGEQAGATVYRNASWGGPVLSLASVPREPLSAAGLAALASSARPLGARRTADGFELDTPPQGSVVYLAGGTRRGWSIAGVRATPVAAGAYVPASGVGAGAAAHAPGGWQRILYAVQGSLALAVVLAWLAGAYLAGPQAAGAPPDIRLTPIRAGPLLAPAALVGAAIAVGWAAPAGALAPGVLSSAWFCPPAGEGLSQRLAVVNAGRRPVRYVLRPAVGAGASASDTLPPGRRITLDANPSLGGVVEAFGGRLVVASIVGGDGGGDTSPCASAPRRQWLFGEGGRSALAENGVVRTGFLIGNAFPELARVSVRFFTADEAVSPPGLQDVRVESGRSALVDPESQLEPQQVLGAEVVVWQGRAVVARRLRRGTTLLSWTLGSGTTSGGVVPRASTQGYTTTLVAVNPSDAPARVSTEVAGVAGSFPGLSFDVDAEARQTFELSSPAPDQPQLFIRLSARPPVAIESVVVGADHKDTSIFPALPPARSWALPAAEGRIITLANPGPDAVTVDVRRLGAGYPIAPVRVPAGRFATITPTDPSLNDPFGLVLTARRGRIVVSAAGPGGASVAQPVGY